MSDAVRFAVERALIDLLGEDASVTKWDGPHERDWSWQWSITVAGREGGDLVLKVPRWDEAPTLADALAAGEQDSTHAEIDGLRRVELAVLSSGDPGLTAVEPVGYVADVNGILMRRLLGESLRERLGVGRGKGDVEALFDRLGRWIGVFHAIDGPRIHRPFQADASVEASRALEHRLRAAGETPRGLLPALAMTRMAAEELDGVEEPWAEIHGDLNAGNVLIGSDDRIAVIDPNQMPGPALTDAVHLITDIRLDRRQLVTAGVTRPFDLVDAWERRLFGGAGLLDEPLGAYRLAAAAVERWASLELDLDGAARAGLLAGRPLLRRTVRRRLAALA